MQASARLAIQEVVQLAFVVVQRYEREPEGAGRLELLLESEQPWDLLLTRGAPGSPEVDPRPFTGADGQRLGQLGCTLGCRARYVLLRQCAAFRELASAQRARLLRRGGLACLDGDGGRRAQRSRSFLSDGLAALVGGHRRVLLRHRIASAQAQQSQAQRETQSRQSTHDTNALRLMASSSHLRSPRELGLEQ